MIPKKIHYCWFGGAQKSAIIKKCIESWKRNCPDYEIIEWNESNFDIDCIPYVREAYSAKKWAFVSDYARLYVVYNQGGVYLDTDVLLHNKIDELLDYECWLASDDVRYVNTGLGFGAEKGNSLIGAIMKAYKEYEYPNGTNVTRDTKIVEQEWASWIKSDKSQVIDKTLVIGVKDYGKYASHLYLYTWADEETRIKREIDICQGKKNRWEVKVLWKLKCIVRNPKLIAYFDKKRGTKIERIYTFIAYDFLDNGCLYFAKKIYLRIKKKYIG